MSILKVRKEQHRIYWHIDRPERGNALGPRVANELWEASEQLFDPSVKILIITAQSITRGENTTWIAGGDLKELAEIKEDQEAAKAYAQTLSAVCTRFAALNIPVIAAIDGRAIGGGAELALWCDERLMTQRSTLEFRQMEVGLATGYGSSKRLCDLLGLARAQKLLFQSVCLTAEEAFNWQLSLAPVADSQDLWPALEKVIARWERFDPRAIAAQKRMFFAASYAHPGAVQNAELEAFAAAWGNPTHQKHLELFSKPSAT